jgi:hypothetical protein
VEIGFNDDVKHRNTTFHIQTEDHGNNDPRVSTQLFLRGRILDSKTVSYGPLMQGMEDAEERKAKIRRVMLASHRNFYKRLLAGEYDEAAGLPPLGGAQDARQIEAAAESFQPTQAKGADEQNIQVLEEDGKVTFTFDDGNMVDLRSLGNALKNINVMPPKGGKASDQFKGLGFDEDLSAELEVSHSMVIEDEPPPKRRRRAQEEDDEPWVPRFRPTGRRAFQGLLEPPEKVDVVQLVTDFLKHLNAQRHRTGS